MYQHRLNRYTRLDFSYKITNSYNWHLYARIEYNKQLNTEFTVHFGDAIEQYLESCVLLFFFNFMRKL